MHLFEFWNSKTNLCVHEVLYCINTITNSKISNFHQSRLKNVLSHFNEFRNYIKTTEYKKFPCSLVFLFHLLQYYPGKPTGGQYGQVIFSFKINCQVVFQRVCSFLISYKQWKMTSIVPKPSQHLLLLGLCVLSIFTVIWNYCFYL